MAADVSAGYRQRCDEPSDIVEYLPLLNGIVRLYSGCRVLEIGTRAGNSTLAFLDAARAAGGHVWSVDINPRVPQNPRGMKDYADCEQWTFIAGDSTSLQVAARLPAQVDVLFIDSSHDYAATLAELARYMPRVAPGGTALFHDTRLPQDVYGTRRALDEYCEANGLAWYDLPGGYGLGIAHIPLPLKPGDVRYAC